MSKWSEYYVDRIGNSYARYCNTRYLEFINALLSVIPKNPRKNFKVREEGCGIATFTRIIKTKYERDLKISCFDSDIDQCFNARENLKGLGISVYIDDILRIPTKRTVIDLIFSHGVLEHFDYKDIKKILKRQKKEATHVIHYVPTDGYDKPSFGDERLLPVDWWVTNFEPTEHIVFNDGKDLVLIWE